MAATSHHPRRSWAGPLWAGARYAAENTPPERDRVVDVLRSFSLMVVVFGHLMMALVVWSRVLLCGRHCQPNLLDTGVVKGGELADVDE